MASNEKVAALVGQIEEGVRALFDSDKYREYLDTLGKFYHYSVNNSILIAMQRPDATAVASYTSWKNNFDRHVKEGAKGIQIIQPSPYKVKEKVDVVDPNGKKRTEEVETIVQGFKVGYVFALEDTEGTPLPEIATKLTEDVKDYELMKNCLIEASPVPISFEPIASSANGYFSIEDKKIVVDDRLAESQTIKTMIHEIAHSILPDKDTNRREREVEAESVAYTVASYYGIDTSDYTFGYVAGWSKDKDLTELKEHLEEIKTAAGTIIDSVDDNLIKYRLTNKSDEVALQYPEGYCYIQASEGGFDYTLYNRFGNEVDGGKYVTNKNIADAYKDILKNHNIDSKSVAFYDAGSLLKKVEEVNKVDTTVADVILSKSQHIKH